MGHPPPSLMPNKITIRILVSFAPSITLEGQAGSDAIEMETGVDCIRRAHPAGCLTAKERSGAGYGQYFENNEHHSP